MDEDYGSGMDSGYDDSVDEIPEDDMEDIPEEIPEDDMEDIPEEIPEDDMEDIPDEIPEDDMEDIPEEIPEEIPEDDMEDIPEDIPEDVPEDEPVESEQDMTDDLPEDISEDVPEDVPEDDSYEESDDITDEIPEDVPEEEEYAEPEAEEIPEDIASEETTDYQEDSAAEDQTEYQEDAAPEDQTEYQEDVPEDEPVESEQDMMDDLPEDISEDVPEDVPEDDSYEESDDITDEIPEDVPEEEEYAEPEAEEIPEDTASEETAEYQEDAVPEDQTEYQEDAASEDQTEYQEDAVPEDQTDYQEDTTQDTESTNAEGVDSESEDTEATESAETETEDTENTDIENTDTESEASETADVGTEDSDNNSISDSGSGIEIADIEKTAYYENCSYQQGNNEFGYLGTCGPTSVANALNRVTGTSEFTENAVLRDAIENELCSRSTNPYQAGGTGTQQIAQLINKVTELDGSIHTDIREYGNAPSVSELADMLDKPNTVAMVGVDSATLWDRRGDITNSDLFGSSDYSDHWITVDSPTYNENGNLEGFNVIDSGGGVDYVNRDKFERMYLGDASHEVLDPTAIMISKEEDTPSTVDMPRDSYDAPYIEKGAIKDTSGTAPPSGSDIFKMSDSREAFDRFQALDADTRREVFEQMSSQDVFTLVQNADSQHGSWTTTDYDLVTPENAKDFIKMVDSPNGDISFNYDWPPYGGYDPSTIHSLGDLSGKIPVSRDGGDGGFTVGLGKNEDGTWATNSERSIPKTSAELGTGEFDVDKYKQAVDILANSEASSADKIGQLGDMGIDPSCADKMMHDYDSWAVRYEISGPNNIAEGARNAGIDVDSKYGYCGKAAPWEAGNVHMRGGAGQMNPVLSWGILKRSGIVSSVGKVRI